MNSTLSVEEIHMVLGEYIKKAREKNKMTQQELADKVGFSQSYIGRVESGLRKIDFGAGIKLIDAVGMDVRDFAHKYL